MSVGLVVAFAGDSVLLALHNAKTAEIFFGGALALEAERFYYQLLRP